MLLLVSLYYSCLIIHCPLAEKQQLNYHYRIWGRAAKSKACLLQFLCHVYMVDNGS